MFIFHTIWETESAASFIVSPVKAEMRCHRGVGTYCNWCLDDLIHESWQSAVKVYSKLEPVRRVVTRVSWKKSLAVFVNVQASCFPVYTCQQTFDQLKICQHPELKK